jgi:hypothetical protein
MVLYFKKNAHQTFPELEARYMRIRFICFRLYNAHVRRKFAPGSSYVTGMIDEWADEDFAR